MCSALMTNWRARSKPIAIYLKDNTLAALSIA